MSEPNVIPATEAARRAGCSRQAIYQAIQRGALTGVRMGPSRLVKLDSRWERYTDTGSPQRGSEQAKQAS